MSRYSCSYFHFIQLVSDVIAVVSTVVLRYRTVFFRVSTPAISVDDSLSITSNSRFLWYPAHSPPHIPNQITQRRVTKLRCTRHTHTEVAKPTSGYSAAMKLSG